MISLKMDLWLVPMLALTLTACGEKKDESATEETDDPSGTVAGNGGAAVDQKGKDFSVVGNWLGGSCPEGAALDDQGGGGDEEHFTQGYEFGADLSLKVSRTMYADPECAEPVLEMNVEGTYLLGAEVSAEPLTKEIDLTVVSGTVTIRAQGMVDDLNGGSSLNLAEGEEEGGGFCTKADPWVLDEAVSLADLECSEDFPQPGRTFYDVVSVKGDEMIQSGGGQEEGKDGKTPETRTTKLGTGPEDVLHRQTAE